MQITFVIISHNRRNTLLASLSELPNRVGLPLDQWEMVVVDNNSTDGTAQAVRSHHPTVRLIEQPGNNPCAARNTGAAAAKAPVLCFLDDDSLPRMGTTTAALEHLKQNPDTVLLGGPVHLPGGRQDACALPLIPPACGLIVQTNAFRQADGFDEAYHMAAEEYELAFRLAKLGGAFERLPKIVFDHEKTPGARTPKRIMFQDLRNNLLLLKRHIPEPWRSILLDDWTMRYSALMHHMGDGNNTAVAIKEADAMHQQSPPTTPLNDKQLQMLFGFQHQADQAALFAQRTKSRNIAIADHSKTTYATYKACRDAGMNIVAILDNHPAYRELQYRGLPIIADKDLDAARIDAISLSNINPAQIDHRIQELSERFNQPILSMADPLHQTTV